MRGGALYAHTKFAEKLCKNNKRYKVNILEEFHTFYVVTFDIYFFPNTTNIFGRGLYGAWLNIGTLPGN